MVFTEISGELQYVMDIKTNLQITDLEWVVREEVGTVFDVKTHDFGHGTETATIEKFILTPEEEASEQRWDELFADPRSEQLLEELSQKALAEYRAGRTQELDPDEL